MLMNISHVCCNPFPRANAEADDLGGVVDDGVDAGALLEEGQACGQQHDPTVPACQEVTPGACLLILAL